MRISAGAAQVSFEERGRGDVLVLLHAFPFDRRMWVRQVGDLQHAMRVVTVDFRGMGDSTGSGTVDDAADDVARVLRHLNIKRATVAGLSMGGYVALAFARRHADLLEGLMLADTRAAPDDEASRTARDEAIVRVAREGMSSYARRTVPRLLSGKDPRPVELAIAMAEIQSPEGVAGALAALRDRPDARPALADIAVPTLVVVGTDDVVTPPAMSREMADAISGAEYRELPGAGHLSNLEAPAAFADAVEHLMDRVRAARK